ncbi:AraC-type DNA-binding protein [Pedobacter caeni]|uniref:AraC-type DNA-binding protein n=1 Tax=Pedobacter caeni TaxID=288992 RepID=A0A1M4WIG7_9SPHI|nr:AraC-type DNA-binding protein [Pedobacter caeni]
MRPFIQSFLFFRSDGSNVVDYTTFPNTNLCLAIYKNNTIDYQKNAVLNRCELNTGGNGYQSRLYGFHQNPFQVRVNADLDQICILFHPGALRAFSHEPFENLLPLNQVFEAVFKTGYSNFPEQLFNEKSTLKRADLLEEFLEKQLMSKQLHTKVNEAIFVINAIGPEQMSVERLAKELNINPSTLYRLFSAEIGQSPKSFLQTLRFRKALTRLNPAEKLDLTNIAYLNNYYDQAHFTKEVKALAGATPSQLKRRISIEQDQLIWLYNKQD